MGKIRNRSTIPQGMLAPSGLAPGHVNPAVQATTRPGGTLLEPSPGYDSVRRGKNRFQGKGFSGGFRAMEYAEDIGNGGAVLSVIPGMTSSIEASEWLPESPDSLPEGSVIIADRTHELGFAEMLHEAYQTIPDMGDRHPERPLTKNQWLRNPVGLFRKDYREHPVITLIASAGFVWLVNIVARDLESGIRGYRPRGVGTAVTEPAATATETGGDVAKQASDAAGKAVDQIGNAADEAVNKIGNAADSAVQKIENAAS